MTTSVIKSRFSIFDEESNYGNSLETKQKCYSIKSVDRLPDDKIKSLVSIYREFGNVDICIGCVRRDCTHEKVLIRDALIVSHIPLALYHTSKSGFSSFTKDEYLSEQLYALVDGVTKAKEALVNDDITPYLKSNMRSKGSNYRSRLPIVRIPRSSMHRKGILPVSIKTFNELKHKATAPDLGYDLLDFIHKHVQEPDELIVIEGLKEGLNNKEIAQELGKSNTHVANVLKRLRKRLMESVDGCYDYNLSESFAGR